MSGKGHEIYQPFERREGGQDAESLSGSGGVMGAVVQGAVRSGQLAVGRRVRLVQSRRRKLQRIRQRRGA